MNLEQKDSLLALLEDLRQRPQLKALHQLLSYRLQKQENNYEGLKKFLLEECDATQVTASQYNELAWRALFEETLSEEALTYARKAFSIAGDSNSAILHTLATLYAESGRNVEARQLLVQTIEAGTSLSAQSNDWYIIGRLAEQYGLSGSAIEAYNKVEKPELESDIPYSTWVLAQRALKRVNQAEPQ